MFPATFYTVRLVLRPIAPDDADPIFETYARDPEVTRFLTWRPHQRLGDTQAYIGHCLATSPSVFRTYVLVGRDDAILRGAIDLRLPERHRMSFGYVLGHTFWNQGLMTEALREVAQWALAQPHIFRIGSVCDIENVGSARVMQKAGLTNEGILRRWAVHPNISREPRDCFSYGRVR